MIYDAGKVDVPRQLVIKKDASSIPDAVTKAGLMLPLGICLVHSVLLRTPVSILAVGYASS